MYDIVYNSKQCIVREHTNQSTKDSMCITCYNKTEVAGFILTLKNKYKNIKIKIEADGL